MKNIRILNNINGMLCLFQGEIWEEVTLKENFPWSNPGCFFSVRNREDEEIFFINKLDDLCFCEQKAVTQYLSRLKFTFNITQIISISEEYELRKYEVKTTQGDRIFYTPIDDWPTRRENESIIIIDVSKDIYQISNLNTLDPVSRKRISHYVD